MSLDEYRFWFAATRETTFLPSQVERYTTMASVGTWRIVSAHMIGRGPSFTAEVHRCGAFTVIGASPIMSSSWLPSSVARPADAASSALRRAVARRCMATAAGSDSSSGGPGPRGSIPLTDAELPRVRRSNSDDPSATATGKKRKKTSMDDILNDVLLDAVAARDRGERPDMDYVYKKTQEKCYEAEHGRPPPSKNANYEQHLPMPPDVTVRRLIPLTMYDDDPFQTLPQFDVSPVQPPQQEASSTTTMRDPAAANDDAGTRGGATTPITSLSRAPPSAEAVEALACELISSLDEIVYWEEMSLDFIRDYPLGLRRALPLLQDQYKHLAHRYYKAEQRFLKARNAFVGSGAGMSTQVYAMTEDRVERARLYIVETHKSLTSNYDPLRMKKSFTGKVLSLSEAQYGEWKASNEVLKNSLAAALSADRPAG